MPYGPAALVGTAERLGWKVHDASTLSTDKGRTLSLDDDPPIVLARQANDAVRRWRWKQIAEQHPALPSEGANFGPILKLLRSKRNDELWNPALRGALTSLVVGRQYTQYRCFQAGWTLHS